MDTGHDDWWRWEKQVAPRRIDWTNVAIWGGIVVGSIVFWYFIIMTAMLLLGWS